MSRHTKDYDKTGTTSWRVDVSEWTKDDDKRELECKEFASESAAVDHARKTLSEHPTRIVEIWRGIWESYDFRDDFYGVVYDAQWERKAFAYLDTADDDPYWERVES